ncbi:MAG: TetR/AcrR family transcriptional regulator [Amnibacterium sp.]
MAIDTKTTQAYTGAVQSSTRSYRMTARGEAVAATRRRILAAVRDLAYERLDFDPTLDAVASRAQVSVQTVLRHFSTREGLLDAAFVAAAEEIVAERRPPSRDVDDALSTLLGHYEARGEFVLAMLAREAADERVARITGNGKRVHRDWVAAVFDDRLPATGDRREALLDLLVVATDVYAWKLLRVDRGLPLHTVRARMRAMTDALVGRAAPRPAVPEEGSEP